MKCLSSEVDHPIDLLVNGCIDVMLEKNNNFCVYLFFREFSYSFLETKMCQFVTTGHFLYQLTSFQPVIMLVASQRHEGLLFSSYLRNMTTCFKSLTCLIPDYLTVV